MTEEKKFIIVHDGEKNEHKKNKMTWAKYGRQVNRFKFWILGITLAGAVLGYVGVEFVYNPGRENITTDITLNLALRTNKDSSDNVISTNYMDGSPFNYTDIVATSHLEAVKNSDSATFASISIERITESDAISISPKTTTDSDTSETISLTNQYVLTTVPKYFGGEKVARAFIKALLNYEVEVSNEALDSYSIESTLPSSEANFMAMEMSEMASAITNQYDVINDTYVSLINTFSGSLQVNGGTLSSIKKSFDASVSEQKIKTLVGEQNSNHYVNFDGSTQKNAQDKIKEYQLLATSYQAEYNTTLSQMQANESLLKDLTSIQMPGEDISAKIVSLSDSVTKEKNTLYEIESEMLDIGYTLSEDKVFERTANDTNSYLYHLDCYSTHFEDGSQEWTTIKDWYDSGVSFKETLKEFYGLLSTCYTECNQANRGVYKKNYNRIYVAQSNMGTLNSHTSPILGMIGGLVLFYLVSSLIFAFVGINKEGKAQPEEKKPDAPSSN